jgi:3-phenylpropionate/cinnamic acid dioxygenase small subunit
MPERHDDIEAIRGVLVRYCHLCDEGRFDEWGELFTEDATFTVLGETHRGRPAVQEFIEGAQPPEQRGKHMLSEPLIDVHDDEASAWTDYLFVGRHGGGLAVTSTGRYHDRLARQDGVWRIASREIVFVGDQPTGSR